MFICISIVKFREVSLTRLVMSCHVMSGVGKTSIIDQFGRSEHEDVFNRDTGEAGEEAAAARWGDTEYLLKYSSASLCCKKCFRQCGR